MDGASPSRDQSALILNHNFANASNAVGGSAIIEQPFQDNNANLNRRNGNEIIMEETKLENLRAQTINVDDQNAPI